MNDTGDVLERKVINPGKPFIREGEEHARAYIVQNGLISAYVMDGDKKIEVSQYGSGRIIGEICLMSDEPMTMSYEALTDTTVVTLTRSEFQKKIAKLDKNISTILEHVMNKLNFQYAEDVEKARKKVEIDPDSYEMVKTFIGKIPEQKRFKYEEALVPHISAILKEIKRLKEEDEKNTQESE